MIDLTRGIVVYAILATIVLPGMPWRIVLPHRCHRRRLLGREIGRYGHRRCGTCA